MGFEKIILKKVKKPLDLSPRPTYIKSVANKKLLFLEMEK